MWSEGQLKWYDKMNKARPTHIPHNVDPDSLRDKMERLMPKKWHMEGNQLTGITESGVKVVQFLPTDVILKGTDENGLPIFERIVVH